MISIHYSMLLPEEKKGHANHLRPLKKDQCEVEALLDKLYLINSENDAKSNSPLMFMPWNSFKIDTIYKYCYVNSLVQSEEGTIDIRIQKVLDDLNEIFARRLTLKSLPRSITWINIICHIFLRAKPDSQLWNIFNPAE